MALRATGFLPVTTARSAIVDSKADLSPGGRGGAFLGMRSSPLLAPSLTSTSRFSRSVLALALDGSAGDGISKKVSSVSGAVPNTNYVVPFSNSPSSSCITRPLAEILRDLNKRIPDNIVKPDPVFIPWFHANRMLSFYAPGWCGEIRDVIFSDNGSVTVVYRVTIRGSDGEAYRESTGTISSNDGNTSDPVAAAEQVAFVRACARFGLGLYLYHDE